MFLSSGWREYLLESMSLWVIYLPRWGSGFENEREWKAESELSKTTIPEEDRQKEEAQWNYFSVTSFSTNTAIIISIIEYPKGTRYAFYTLCHWNLTKIYKARCPIVHFSNEVKVFKRQSLTWALHCLSPRRCIPQWVDHNLNFFCTLSPSCHSWKEFIIWRNSIVTPLSM